MIQDILALTKSNGIVADPQGLAMAFVCHKVKSIQPSQGSQGILHQAAQPLFWGFFQVNMGEGVDEIKNENPKVPHLWTLPPHMKCHPLVSSASKTK